MSREGWARGQCYHHGTIRRTKHLRSNNKDLERKRSPIAVSVRVREVIRATDRANGVLNSPLPSRSVCVLTYTRALQ